MIFQSYAFLPKSEGLLVPYAAGEGCALGWYFAGFGLLGIGNTAIQVAVNPLLATIVPAERMTSYLTVGQIFRNTSLLLLAPIVTGEVADPHVGGDEACHAQRREQHRTFLQQTEAGCQ